MEGSTNKLGGWECLLVQDTAREIQTVGTSSFMG